MRTLKVRTQDLDVQRKIQLPENSYVQSGSSPSLEEWFDWPRERIARWIMRHPHPLVFGWPFNGTRRWYLLHRRSNPQADDYVKAMIQCQAKQHRLLFEHGATVILAPCFGYELLNRGEDYTKAVLHGLLQAGDDPVYREMFDAGVRLRFYGDYEEVLSTPTFQPMLEACEELMAATASGDGPLLLIGLFADAPYPRLARLSVDFAARWGRPPNRRGTGRVLLWHFRPGSQPVPGLCPACFVRRTPDRDRRRRPLRDPDTFSGPYRETTTRDTLRPSDIAPHGRPRLRGAIQRGPGGARPVQRQLSGSDVGSGQGRPCHRTVESLAPPIRGEAIVRCGLHRDFWSRGL